MTLGLTLGMATPEAGFVWQLILTIGLVAAIGANLAVIFSVRKTQKREIYPQPLDVTGDLRVTPKGRRFNAETCDAKHKSVEERVANLEVEKNRIYTRIDEVNERANENLNRAMDGLKETIRKLPAEVLSLLKTTGQLKDHER